MAAKKKKKKKTKKSGSPVLFVLFLLLLIFLLTYYLFPDFYKSLIPKEKTPIDPDYPAKLVDKEEIDGKLQVHFISVGQGDAAVILTPDGKTVMIDCGPNDAESTVRRYLKKLGVKKIDLLFLTHPHEDHIGGADQVLLRFDVKKLMLPEVIATTGSYENMLNAVAKRDTELKTVKAYEEISLGDVRIEVLGPIELTGEKDGSNNDSLVLKFTYGETSFLFMGDAEKEEEDTVLERYGDLLKADLIKLGHHGSSSSTSKKLLTAAGPKYAVACCGFANEFGHPSAVVVSRLRDAGISLYRTDLQGDLIFWSDGQAVH